MVQRMMKMKLRQRHSRPMNFSSLQHLEVKCRWVAREMMIPAPYNTSQGMVRVLLHLLPVPGGQRGQVRSGQVRSGQDRSGQVRSGHIGSSQIVVLTSEYEHNVDKY